MRAKIKLIVLGVDDLERSLKFYHEGLGLPTKGIEGSEHEDGAIVFFSMNEDLLLALYPRKALAKDANILEDSKSRTEFSIGHIVESKDEVDAVIQKAQEAGAEITDYPHDRFWGGYSGYFQDPDGHLWEIAWHPTWSLNL